MPPRRPVGGRGRPGRVAAVPGAQPSRTAGPRATARTGGSAAAAPAAATATTAAGARRGGRCGRRPARGDGDRRQELHRVVVPGGAVRGGGGLRHRAAEFEGVAAGPAAVLVARHAHRLARDGRARGVSAPAPSRIGSPREGGSAAGPQRREGPAPGTSRSPPFVRAGAHRYRRRYGRRYPYPRRDGRHSRRDGRPRGGAVDTGRGTAHTSRGTAHSSRGTAHSSLDTTHTSRGTAHSSRGTAHSSLDTTHTSRGTADLGR